MFCKLPSVSDHIRNCFASIFSKLCFSSLKIPEWWLQLIILCATWYLWALKNICSCLLYWLVGGEIKDRVANTVKRKAMVQSHDSAVGQNPLWYVLLLCSGRSLALHITPEGRVWHGMHVFVPNLTLSAFQNITVFGEPWILPDQQAWVG